MTVLLVMAKAPVPGAVKTRLCPPASHLQAARIAAAALLDSLDTVRATPGVTPVLALHGRLADAEEAAELTAAIAGWQILAAARHRPRRPSRQRPRRRGGRLPGSTGAPDRHGHATVDARRNSTRPSTASP